MWESIICDCLVYKIPTILSKLYIYRADEGFAFLRLEFSAGHVTQPPCAMYVNNNKVSLFLSSVEYRPVFNLLLLLPLKYGAIKAT